MRRVVAVSIGCAGLLTAAGGVYGQIAAINDTNTAIILWTDQSRFADNQPRVIPGTRPGAAGAQRRGIGIGQQGYGTVLAPQSSEPAIAPQANEPMIGQQGSPAAIPSITNQASVTLPPTPPLWPQTNSAAFGPQGAIGIGQQGFGTALGPQGQAPAMGQQGFGTAIEPQPSRPALGVQPGSPALGQPGRPVLTPGNPALTPPGGMMGGAQGTPGGQTSGSGSK